MTTFISTDMQRIRNIALLLGLCAMVVSCVTTSKTAKTTDINAETHSVTVADLKVSENRIDYTMNPVPKSILRGGENNVKRAAEYEALKQNGEGDVLLEPEYVISKKRTLFGSKISAITVTGRPATYTNFRTLNDSVWTDPVFRNRTNSNGFSKGKQSKDDSNIIDQHLKGFRASIALDGGMGFWDEDPWQFRAPFDGDCFTTFTVTGGYQFNKNLFAGIGFGGMYIGGEGNEAWTLPLFFNARWNFIGNKNIPKVFPFLDVRVGGAFVVSDNYFSDNLDNTWFFSPSVGLSFRCAKMKTFDIAIQMTNLSGKEDYYHKKLDINRFTYGIRLGYSF